MRRAWWLVVMLASCLRSQSIECTDGRSCPGDKVCDDVHALCIQQHQINVKVEDCASSPSDCGAC